MKTLRSMLLGSIMLIGMAASPVWASADSGDEQPPMPNCTIEPELCQAMLEQYMELYGSLPDDPEAEPTAVVEIEMTGGEEPPKDVVAEIRRYEGELRKVTQNFCANQEWQEIIDELLWRGTYADRQAVIDKWSTFTEDVGYQPVHAEYADYLQDQAAAGYNVPSRPPTMWELVQLYPGCDEGNYKLTSK